jgi:hypothetical protein
MKLKGPALALACCAGMATISASAEIVRVQGASAAAYTVQSPASAAAPADSAASVPMPGRIPEGLIVPGLQTPASTKDQLPRLDEAQAPWAEKPARASGNDAITWINGEPEQGWLRAAVAYAKENGLTMIIVALSLVAVAWLCSALITYLKLHAVQPHDVRRHRRRHRRSSEHRDGDHHRSDDKSVKRERRHRRHSRPPT